MALKPGTETGSFINYAMSGQPAEIAETINVGDPATVLAWTDRYPATVIEVRRGKRPVIVIQEDKATRTDTNGMSESQTYQYERDPQGQTWEVSWRKNGWRTRGSDNGVRFGVRKKYHDYSF